MKRKTLHKILGLIMVIGFLIIFCAAGASDSGSIDFKTLIVRGGFGLFLMLAGAVGLKLSGYEN